MKKILVVLFALSLSAIFAQACQLIWEQYPDANGVDVAFGEYLCDDFEVTSSYQWVCAINFWISWQEDIVGTITAIHVNIYDNNVNEPGNVLWSFTFAPGDEVTTVGYAGSGTQAFYDPATDTYTADDHNDYYLVGIGVCSDPYPAVPPYPISHLTEPFWGTPGETYWLGIDLEATGGVPGWKTSATDNGFVSAFWETGGMTWEDVVIAQYDATVSQALTICGCHEHTCPVELASFDAAVTHSNFVQLNWTTESESDLLGYNVLRSETTALNEAIPINTEYIQANNTTNQSNYVFTDTEVEMNRIYHYWLESIEMNGQAEFFGPVSVTVEDGGGQTPPDPTESIAMFTSVYPNPFNPCTSFKYSLPEAGEVTFNIYNTKGQLVDTIVHHGDKGENHVGWDAAEQASGIYMVHMETENFSSMRKAVLIK